jgi:uncharacterized SAM-binding protein YcdF (DUF218 family)
VTTNDGDLSVYPEVAVVVGGGISPDGAPTASTTARARAAAHLASKRPDLAIILSGSDGDGPAATPRSEAAIMADLIVDTGIDRGRLFLEERSRDTIGNGVEVVSQFLGPIEPRPLYLITSPFHLERALVVFRHLLGFAWQVQAVAAEDTADDLDRAKKETFYLQETFAFFEGTRPGDWKAIEKRFRARQGR